MSTWQWAITEKNEHILVGKISRSQIENQDSFKWFNTFYPLYKIADTSAFNYIKTNKAELSFNVVCGTWCEDTHFLLPQFLHFCDLVGISEKQMKLIAVDRKKELQNHQPNGYSVTNIPAIIIYKNNKEVGRIVESVKDNIEKDIYQVLNK